MTYATVCSGINAPGVAWHTLGWRAAFHAEIEPFPCAALAHYEPQTPNLGNMEAISREQIEGYRPISVFCAGTPCQSFSVAGLRGGMADPRGNLALVFLRLVDWLRPAWVVWENVPGVLSSNGGRDFGSILGGLGELGYGWAYRVLDAQYFGVPQRRRRVFVVGCLGGWSGAAAVLFERHSLSGNPPPSREAGQRIAAGLTRGADSSGAGGYAGRRREDDYNIVGSLNANGKAAGSATQQDAEAGMLVTHALRAEGFDASEDGTGRGIPLVPVAIQEDNQNGVTMRDTAGSLRSDAPGTQPCGTLIGQPIPIDMRQASRGATMTNNRGDDVCSGGAPGTGIGEAGDPAPSVAQSHPPAVAFNWQAGGSKAMLGYSETHSALQRCQIPAVQRGMAVRRLLPVECEKLQGFPDNYTAIPFRNKPAADGPRYRSLGNSMAVPVLLWIGKRIEAVENVLAREVQSA